MCKQICISCGNLTPLENLPFKPKRVFWVHSTQKNELRGQHAHKKCKQLLICIQGQIKVLIYDGITEKNIILEPNEFILINEMVWSCQTYMTDNDILMVLCSDKYDKKDYITDITKFNTIIRKK